MTAPTIARGHPSEPGVVAPLVTDVVRAVLGPARTRSVVIGMSKDENPKATVLVQPDGASAPSLAIKVGMTPGAGEAVLREAAALQSLEQADPALVHGTVPRCLEVRTSGGHAVLVTSVCPGVPLSTTYHRWRHTARAERVRADFTAAATWLDDLGRLPGQGGDPRADGAWSERIRSRWPGDEAAEEVALAVADRRDRIGAIDGSTAGMVHGDFWCGNVLHLDGAVTGVVDWEHARQDGDPLRDRVRFALAYALYLDRHTASGHRVAGHPGLVAGPWGEPVRHLLRGSGWFPELVAGFVGEGLSVTGRDPAHWPDALLLGLAEVAALSDHPAFARQHLELAREALSWLP